LVPQRKRGVYAQSHVNIEMQCAEEMDIGRMLRQLIHAAATVLMFRRLITRRMYITLNSVRIGPILVLLAMYTAFCCTLASRPGL
jgi:hypothetical protein